MITMAQLILCNRTHRLDQRAARWLLRVDDRVDERPFGVTQEFLAQMIGVQRPALSVAMRQFRRPVSSTIREDRSASPTVRDSWRGRAAAPHGASRAEARRLGDRRGRRSKRAENNRTGVARTGALRRCAARAAGSARRGPCRRRPRRRGLRTAIDRLDRVPPRSITSPISWIPFVTGSSAVSDDRLRGLVELVPRARSREKNTDASSGSGESWTTGARSPEHRGDQHPRLERGQDASSATTPARSARVAEHRHVAGPKIRSANVTGAISADGSPNASSLADDELAEPDR